jgi:hypothetical protein
MGRVIQDVLHRAAVNTDTREVVQVCSTRTYIGPSLPHTLVVALNQGAAQ